MMQDPTDELRGFFDKCMGNLMISVIVLLFCYLGGFLGSMTMRIPVAGAIVGAVIGAIVGLLVGYMATGKWKKWFERDGLFDLPKVMQPLLYERDTFVLIITIKEVQNQLQSQFRPNDSYVMLTCGKNPVKTTCVRQDGKWNETFKLTVDPRDKHCFLADGSRYHGG